MSLTLDSTVRLRRVATGQATPPVTAPLAADDLRLRPHAGARRDRDLRRHGRSHGAQAPARPLQPGRPAAPAPGDGDHRGRALGPVRRRVPRPHARGRREAQPLPRGRRGLGGLRPPAALRVGALRRGRGLPAPGATSSRRRTATGARAATASSTSPRRPSSSPRSPRAWAASGWPTRATAPSASPGWSSRSPSGEDLASARELNARLNVVFRERQVYRIDHYLGKETVQNLLVLRFGNAIFEPIWNRRYVDHVQITVAEDLGVGTRGGYYDQSGALRDIVQNHMLQVLSIIAMEPPARFESRDVRDEKVKVLRAIPPLRRPGGCRARRGARAVRCGVDRGRAGPRLPRGGRRRSRSPTPTPSWRCA